METFYWFRDGQFGEVEAYTWEEAKKVIGPGKFVADPTATRSYLFLLINDEGEEVGIPRWAMPKEFLVRLVILGVGV